MYDIKLNVDERALQVLQQIECSCQRILGQELVGVYVHGSLAFSCFRWESSDIDYLIVTRSIPDLEQKEALIRDTLRLDRIAPTKGLEMSLVTLKACRDFVYPTPFELHFSHGHLERARKDPAKFAVEMHGTDPDLAAHFTITRHAGFALTGPAIKEVFAPVPREAYLDSIRLDVEQAQQDILRDPVYMILNLCRVCAYIRHGLILSKKDGGLWGLLFVETEFSGIVQRALDAYTKGTDFSGADQPETLCAFARTMVERISPKPVKSTKILRNAIQCNLCGDVIESTRQHEYVRCSCGACAVDGGHEYLRRTFERKDCYTELSVTREETQTQ